MKGRRSCSTPLRAPGQRSLSSTFLFRPAPHQCSASQKEGSDELSGCRSLTAFLNRKLHSTSVLPINKDNSHPNESIVREDQYGPSEERCVIEDSVFKLFHGAPGEKVSESSSEGVVAPGRLECDSKRHTQNHFLVIGDDLRPKRKALSEMSYNKRPRPLHNHSPTTSECGLKKHTQSLLVVLGDDPKPKRRARREASCANEKPKNFYNHYENGTGWWDSGREGLDDDEVGSSEVWEAIGSTTLGGLDWH